MLRTWLYFPLNYRDLTLLPRRCVCVCACVCVYARVSLSPFAFSPWRFNVNATSSVYSEPETNGCILQVTDAMQQDLTNRVAAGLQISNPDLVSVTNLTDARRRLLSVSVGVQALAPDRCNIFSNSTLNFSLHFRHHLLHSQRVRMRRK
jgi:hypothetical protein